MWVKKWWNLLTNFIHLGGPVLWHKDGKLYIIGVHVASSKGKCEQDGYGMAEPIYKHLGWILKHVNGEACSREDKINKWFDQAGEQDDITTWE